MSSDDETTDPLQQMRKRNTELSEQLTLEGKPLPAEVALAVRLDCLLDLLLTQPVRHMYEMHCESVFGQVLEASLADARKPKLHVAEQVLPDHWAGVRNHG